MTTSLANGAVVVGIDATTRTDAALEWAARYASAHRRPLLLLHAAGVPTVYESFTGANDNRQELRIAGRHTLDRAVARAEELAPGIDVRSHLGIGIAHDVILDWVEGAHLLVVGSRGRGSLACLLLGSTSVGMAAQAPCPVMVVRPTLARADGSPYDGKVVVGVDGTDLSLAAIDHAFELASTEDRDLVVLHAWGPGEGHDPASYDEQEAPNQEHYLRVAESLAGFGEKYPDVGVTEYQTHAEPGHEMVRISENAYAVVVGSRGRRDAASVLFGSVSRYVVQHAKCPVLVVQRPVDAEEPEVRS